MNYYQKYHKYKQKYLNLKRNEGQGSGNVKGITLVFGNSHARPFTLINNPNVQVHTYIGATAKGLSKPDNKNRLAIENIVSLAGLKDKINCIIFIFGTVDVLLSPFYLMFSKKQEIDVDEFTSEIVKNYIEYVKTFKADCVLVSEVMYSTLEDKYVIPAMKKYNSVVFNQIKNIDEKLITEKFSRSLRNKFVDSFNENLRRYTKNTDIKILAINSKIIEGDKVKDKYIDQVIKSNIHHIWEEIIIDYIDLFKECECDCGIETKYLDDLEISKAEYVQQRILTKSDDDY